MFHCVILFQMEAFRLEIRSKVHLVTINQLFRRDIRLVIENDKFRFKFVNISYKFIWNCFQINNLPSTISGGR